MTAIATELTRDWHSAVNRLHAAEAHTTAAWLWLTQQAPMSIIAAVPELQTEYTGLHEKGRMIEGTIGTVREAVNRAEQAVRTAYQAAVRYGSGLFGVADLGVVGIISAAAILAAVAAMTYWVTGVVAFRQKVAAIQRLVGEGMTPAAAAAALKSNPGLLGEAATAAKSMAILLGVGTLALFAYRYWSRSR